MKARLRMLLVALSLAACGEEAPDDSRAALEEQQGEKGWGPQKCSAPPEGVEVGYARFDQLGPLGLRTCGGTDVTLADVCGADATWLFLVHMWCPSCQFVANMSESIHDSFAGRNVASLNIIVEDYAGNKPDEEDCLAWREEFEQEDVITLFDPNGASFALWEEPYTSLNVTLDDEQVLMAKFHSNEERVIRTAIESRLAEAAP